MSEKDKYRMMGKTDIEWLKGIDRERERERDKERAQMSRDVCGEREREIKRESCMHAKAESAESLSVPHSVSQSACVIIILILNFGLKSHCRAFWIM